ncbi:zinc finger protein GLI2-like [Callorhinchus milii]|uniref:zinc finger protein GLI2-like n=1 Tax=Callorhinchus milii TaxID=7868 RepID=UPI001C3F659C|nr:zinc finger protein GLI2-like [Callorhinchus milii]
MEARLYPVTISEGRTREEQGNKGDPLTNNPLRGTCPGFSAFPAPMPVETLYHEGHYSYDSNPHHTIRGVASSGNLAYSDRLLPRMSPHQHQPSDVQSVFNSPQPPHSHCMEPHLRPGHDQCLSFITAPRTTTEGE